jgi:hypothetical protein
MENLFKKKILERKEGLFFIKFFALYFIIMLSFGISSYLLILNLKAISMFYSVDITTVFGELIQYVLTIFNTYWSIIDIYLKCFGGFFILIFVIKMIIQLVS